MKRLVLKAGLPLALVFMIGGLIISILVVFQKEPEKREIVERPIAVFAEKVKVEPRNLTVKSQGEVRPRTEIDLATQVGGVIVHVAPQFFDGGVFSSGDVLVRIEDADYRLAVTRAAAQVARAEQNLKREEAEAELAERDWRELGGEGEASALTLRLPQLAQARAEHEAAKADLAEAKLNLKRTEITAPFDGRIRQKYVDRGQFVGPGTPLAKAFATDIVEIRVPLADADLAKLDMPLAFAASTETPGPEALLSTVVAGAAHSWSGRITRTDAAIDSTTRQLFAIIEVEEPYGEGADGDAPLAVGLFVEAKIDGRAMPNALVVPSRSIRSGDKVYIVDGSNRLQSRRVAILASDRDETIIGSGLNDGDLVVVSSIASLEVGTLVQALDQDRTPLRPSSSGDIAATPGPDNQISGDVL
ncbi:MAG: efflux RND transporter periplasmic adaptor subunit [Pseudomonadota bacterium]